MGNEETPAEEILRLKDELLYLTDILEAAKQESNTTTNLCSINAQIRQCYENIGLILRAERVKTDHHLDENTIAFYYLIKKKAAKGNPHATKIYEELRPLYESLLISEMGKN